MGKLKDAAAKAKIMLTGNEPEAPKGRERKAEINKDAPQPTSEKKVKRGKKYTEKKTIKGTLERRGTFRVTKNGKVYTFKTKEELKAFQGGK